MVVTDQTKQIMGVTSTVIRDTVSSFGHPIERTLDWYYVAGLGDIKEHTVSGNHEQIRLVRVTH